MSVIDGERVNQGGLMRCCLASLMERLEAMNETPLDGMTLDCKYEESGNENMIRDNGVWRWNREKFFP